MPEGMIGAVWAFCWGVAAAAGALAGAMLGLITHLISVPHHWGLRFSGTAWKNAQFDMGL
jgi:hypothetical protein